MKTKTFNILLLMASVVIALSSCKGTNSSSEPQNLGTSFIELTKTFIEKEPVQVITPSISDEKVLDEKEMKTYVDSTGKVYLN